MVARGVVGFLIFVVLALFIVGLVTRGWVYYENDGSLFGDEAYEGLWQIKVDDQDAQDLEEDDFSDKQWDEIQTTRAFLVIASILTLIALIFSCCVLRILTFIFMIAAAAAGAIAFAVYADFYSDREDIVRDSSNLSYSFILVVIGTVIAFVTAGLACGMVSTKA
eukprot:TRINITY_DN7468_c0_g1_i2.p1 TRINITY_DN7468_c0_g1~~TRINITY_DN7468_c0_g1_i2.p1  ORF type:complete len:165 (+),score=27.31 TRINITY_DN7468_c0_g1_i2:367-861(+)